MKSDHIVQIDLLAWASELEQERARVDEVNERRARRRGFLIFATDPSVDPGAQDYRRVFATEADTPAGDGEDPSARGRTTAAGLPRAGHYSDQLADARWVA